MGEVQQWLDDATQVLSSAQAIGDKANTQLTTTKSVISQNNSKLIKSNFLLDSTNQLIQLLETIYDSIELRLDDRRKSVDVLDKYLTSNLTQLRNEFDHLKRIKIDPKLLSGDQRSLYDFISTEVLDLLLDKQDQLDSARKSYIEHIENQQKLLKSNLDNFNKTFDNLESEVNETNEAHWISSLIEENNSFEEEIAALLESITNHYDQCTRGVRIMKGEITDITEDEKNDLFKVLQNDSSEVHDVLKDLEESFGDIEQRCSRIETYLNSKFFDIKLKHLVQDLNKFGEDELTEVLNQVEAQTIDIQDLSKDINEKCEEAEKLINHYKQFVKTYYNMILEIHRREKVQHSMEQVFNDAKLKLEALQNEDFKKRDSFIKQNGAYLPNDLWIGINDDSPLCNLKIELYQLPEISSSTITTAKKKINE